MLENVNESQIVQLENLLEILAAAIDNNPGARDLSQLVKQYRETLNELEGLKNEVINDDEIASILSDRKADGKSGALRKNDSNV